MNKDQREHARIVHKDFFDKCQVAIDNQFYLEAILLEYAAMEARVKVIMSLFGLPCAVCNDTNITHNIGLLNKVLCFREIIEKNPEIFENSKFTRSKASRLGDFCTSRDQRIHGLLENTEEYEKLVKRNPKLARQGLELVKLLYNETNRLKRMKKNHPEQFERIKAECGKGRRGSCDPAIKWTEEH